MNHIKTQPHRNAHLLEMARGQSCQFQVPYVCKFDSSTVVAAHSNMASHGKAGARKADDQFVVYACFGCHSWYDSGDGAKDRQYSDALFMVAIERQKKLYKQIINDPSTKIKDRAAAAWALEKLGGIE